MTAIGVLCARVRVEEKQIIASLADAGVVAMPVPPASTPMPPGPASAEMAALGTRQQDGEIAHHELGLVIDRCQNRYVAAALLPLLRMSGITVMDAGVAATGNRLDVASALTRAGIPRPRAFVTMSEASALDAATRLGYPATLFPQDSGTDATTLLDHDTAEAVVEHRVVLGTHGEAIMLLQEGAPASDQIGRHHLVNGQVIATEGDLVSDAAQDVARAAADALGASLVTIDVALINGQLVVWDVFAVADFRKATLTGDRSVGDAIAELTGTTARVTDTAMADVPVAMAQQGWEVQVRDGVIGVSLTA